MNKLLLEVGQVINSHLERGGSVLGEAASLPHTLVVHLQQPAGEIDCGPMAAGPDQLSQAPLVLGHRVSRQHLALHRLRLTPE